MQVYLVGGAVRDELLKRTVKEHDYVVINETPQSMLEKNFKQVGKDFPVFLHPKTHEEYALARTERKIDTGHHGFSMETQNVTLEEDLLRRDITINAMAKDEKGNIIDPYHGKEDLENKVLRHVSDAFTEDPLRVFRVARFQAMLPEFTIHPDTMELMKKLSNNTQEILSLPKERIWKEVEKASAFENLDLFWKTLDECGALKALSLSINPKFLEAIHQAKSKDAFKLIHGLWFHDTPEDFLSLNPPSVISDAIHLIKTEKANLLKLVKDPNIALKTLGRLDPFRRKDRAQRIIQSLPTEELSSHWTNLMNTVLAVDISKLTKNSDSKVIAQGIYNARLDALKHLLENK